jgi:hypothetical protein
MNNETPPASQEPELHPIFPGRTKLYPLEVAKFLGIQKHEVGALILEYIQTGGKSGLRAVSILNDPWMLGDKPMDPATPLACWRIPVDAFDAYMESQKAAKSTETSA